MVLFLRNLLDVIDDLDVGLVGELVNTDLVDDFGHDTKDLTSFINIFGDLSLLILRDRWITGVSELLLEILAGFGTCFLDIDELSITCRAKLDGTKNYCLLGGGVDILDMSLGIDLISWDR